MDIEAGRVKQMQVDIARLATTVEAMRADIAEIKSDVKAALEDQNKRLRELEQYRVQCTQQWVAHNDRHKTENRTLTVISGLISAAFSTVAGWFGSRS